MIGASRTRRASTGVLRRLGGRLFVFDLFYELFLLCEYVTQARCQAVDGRAGRRGSRIAVVVWMWPFELMRAPGSHAHEDRIIRLSNGGGPPGSSPKISSGSAAGVFSL